MSSRLLALPAVVIAVAVLAGCAPAAAPLPTPTAVATPLGDKKLGIVDLLETTGPLASFSAAQEAGTELAVRELNEAGGVLDAPVVVWHRTDSAPATLTDAATTLKVDAAIVTANPEAVAALVAPAASAKVAVTAIGTVKNLTTPTASPYPDASAPASPTGTATPKPSGKTTALATPVPSPVAPAATASAQPTHKPGVPATPSDAFVARLKSSNPFLSDFTYGAESYQLVIALALAATVAKDDAGPSLMRGLEQITTGDVVCTDFAECLTVLKDNRAIKYIGPAGRMAYDARVGVVTFGS